MIKCECGCEVFIVAERFKGEYKTAVGTTKEAELAIEENYLNSAIYDHIDTYWRSKYCYCYECKKKYRTLDIKAPNDLENLYSRGSL